jgi:hypothetical protein
MPFSEYDASRRHVDYHIRPSHSNLFNNDANVAVRESDRGNLPGFTPVEHSCGHDAHQHLFTRAASVALPSTLFPRASGGCPQSLGSKMLYMTAVLDCTFVTARGGPTQARDATLQMWNQISTLYASTFNVYVGLVDIVILESPCPASSEIKFNRACSSSYTITQRLSDFSQWRGAQNTNVSQVSGLYHLLTTCASGSQVGVAWLNTLCQKTAFSQTDQSMGQVYVSGTGVSAAGGTGAWRVVAHEIGHNWGSVHDCTSGNTCPVNSNQCCACGTGSSCSCNAQFLMNPFDTGAATSFSGCSQNMICQKVASIGGCLQEPGKYNTATSFVCGNGVREGTEECDAGGKDDACCTKECKFAPGAKCSKSEGCCSDVCQPLANGTLCRQAKGECDNDEFCNGTSGTCPSDSFQENGKACNASDPQGRTVPAKCANGLCTSRSLQCIARDPVIVLNNSTQGGGVVVGECTQFGNGCSLYCQSRFGECLTFNDYYAPGTACGQNGVCVQDTDGTMVCSNMSPFDQFIYWASKNLIIVIPVAIAIVMILIALATACIRIRRKPQEVKAPASPVFASPNTYNPTNYNQGYVTEFPMQPMNAQQSAYNQRISRVQQYPTYQQSYAPPGSYL